MLHVSVHVCLSKGERIEQSRSMCPFPSLNAIIVCILNIRFIPRASIGHKHFVQTFRLLRKSSTRIKEIVSSRAGFSIRHVCKNRFSCRLKGFFFFFFFDFAFRRPSLTRALWENIFPGWSGATIRCSGLRFIR